MKAIDDLISELEKSQQYAYNYNEVIEILENLKTELSLKTFEVTKWYRYTQFDEMEQDFETFVIKAKDEKEAESKAPAVIGCFKTETKQIFNKK